MKAKHLLWGAALLVVAACSDESLDNGGNIIDNPVVDTYNPAGTAQVLVGQWGQSRSTSLDTWSMLSTRCDDLSWAQGISFTKPDNAINLVENPWANATVGYIPETYSGNIQFNVGENAVIYNYGKDVTFNNCNLSGTVTIYNAGKLNWTVSNGNRHIVYNSNIFEVLNYANIGNVYNIGGTLVLKGTESTVYEWNADKGANDIYTVIKADIPQEMTIHSTDGIVTIPNDADLKATCDIHNKLSVTGNLNIQNASKKYICGLEVTGTLYVNDDNFSTSYLKADVIESQHPIILLREALIEANHIINKNSGSTYIGPEGSHALIRTKDITFRDNRDFSNCYSDNIYFEISGTIHTANYGDYTLDEYISKNGDELGRFTTEISGSPECGPSYGTPGTTPEEPEDPELELVVSVEPPQHDHNEDKTEGTRLLSATSIDWDGNTIYVSYHMRGANYATDTYEKDDVEGCIETWQFGTNDKNQTIIKLGKYMWTYDFDFNHIMLDGNDIVAVGHMGKKGGIISKLPNTFDNFDPSYDDEESSTTSAELDYWILKTDTPVYDNYENESGSITNQKVDYASVGDVNCIIKEGNEYFFTASQGYGRVASDFEGFKRFAVGKDFVETTGSAKHIINNNNEIAVLYLNSRSEGDKITEDDKSTATIATFTTSGFPLSPSITSIATGDNIVQPIDGKNVLAAYGNDYFACLGKGGLYSGGTYTKFGEDGQEPVNGIDIDEEYIYLAVGSHLRVLALNDPSKQIASYHIPNMSSNFVKVVNYENQKYILVAYGQAGIKVFRLNKGN